MTSETVRVDKADLRTPQVSSALLDPSLPTAPTDEEKFTYFGRQHRWFIWLRSLATLSAATSLLLFSNTTVVTWWFWVPFSIFAGYMILTHVCITQRRRFSLLDHQAITALRSPE